MKEYSIEYAHIYTNEESQKEREIEVKILNDIFLKIDRKSSVLLAMVDDYSFPDPTFDYERFKENLKLTGHDLDFTTRESQLIADCDKIITLLNDSDQSKKELIEYIKEKKKYPCSLFIATWYLIRLGIIESAVLPNNLTAKKVMNILPKSFEPFENKAFELIGKTRFASQLSKIENIYFEVRNIS